MKVRYYLPPLLDDDLLEDLLGLLDLDDPELLMLLLDEPLDELLIPLLEGLDLLDLVEDLLLDLDFLLES